MPVAVTASQCLAIMLQQMTTVNILNAIILHSF